MLVTLMFACSLVRSEPDAPFELDGRTMWWIESSADEEGGSATLVVTDEDLGCNDLEDGTPESGAGLWLEVSYDSSGDETFDDPTWPGLYPLGQASGFGPDGSRVRELRVTAFQDGFTFEPAGTTADTWVRLDEVGASVEGEFATAWWSGRIRAESCPGGGPLGECDAPTVSDFMDKYLDRYCEAWETCSDSPCPVFTGGTTTGTAYCDYDRDAGEACVCGEYTCNDDFPGFEFVEPPADCNEVCGSFTTY